MRKLQIVGVVTCSLILVVAGLALAGKKRVGDRNDASVTNCEDIHKVQGKSAKRTVFKVTMWGKIAKPPCKGRFEIDVPIDLNQDKQFDCFVSRGKNASPPGPAVFCGDAPSGPAKFTRKRNVWTISFKTKALKGGLSGPGMPLPPRFGWHVDAYGKNFSFGNPADRTPNRKFAKLRIG
jgi:hypothetical protein